MTGLGTGANLLDVLRRTFWRLARGTKNRGRGFPWAGPPGVAPPTGCGVRHYALPSTYRRVDLSGTGCTTEFSEGRCQAVIVGNATPWAPVSPRSTDWPASASSTGSSWGGRSNARCTRAAGPVSVDWVPP